MTCIVAVRRNGVLYFGADNVTISDYHKMANRDSKIYRREGMIFGTSGPVRLRNLMPSRMLCKSQESSATTAGNEARH